MYGRHCRERLYVIKCPVWIFSILFYSNSLRHQLWMTGSHICIDIVSRYLVPPEMTDDTLPVLSGSRDEGDSQQQWDTIIVVYWVQFHIPQRHFPWIASQIARTPRE